MQQGDNRVIENRCWWTFTSWKKLREVTTIVNWGTRMMTRWKLSIVYYAVEQRRVEQRSRLKRTGPRSVGERRTGLRRVGERRTGPRRVRERRTGLRDQISPGLGHRRAISDNWPGLIVIVLVRF